MPFVFDEIPFEKGKPAGGPTAQPEASPAPFVLWYLDADRFSTEDRPIIKDDAVRLIADSVGSEISRLMSQAPPVEPGDIAVLVRTNDQAQLIKGVLSAGNVPSVLYSMGNIFDSGEAYEMEKILTGVADPSALSRLKAAMATDILGMQAEDLISGDLGSGWW